MPVNASGHCETSRWFVDSCIQDGDPGRVPCGRAGAGAAGQRGVQLPGGGGRGHPRVQRAEQRPGVPPRPRLAHHHLTVAAAEVDSV